MTLKDAAVKALEIAEKHNEGAEMDSAFDAGEFSGPAHDRQMESEIRQLAEANGFTFEEVWGEVIRQTIHDNL